MNEKCGCYIFDTKDIEGLNATIIYCSIHNAAIDMFKALEEIAKTDIEFPYDVVKDMQWTASTVLKKIENHNE